MTSVPIDDNHGTATNASRVFTGVFPLMMIGIRTPLRVEVLKERYAHKFEYGFLVFLRVDVALVHAGAFSQLTGIIPAA
ncbi:MAG: phage major capsid protein [bacterium]|nr:phage major capsid protein [bacterium]